MMEKDQKLLLLKIVQKSVTATMVVVWLYAIFAFATSGMPMIRQMLGCMVTTMIVFGLLSLAGKGLARYRAGLEEGSQG